MRGYGIADRGAVVDEERDYSDENDEVERKKAARKRNHRGTQSVSRHEEECTVRRTGIEHLDRGDLEDW